MKKSKTLRIIKITLCSAFALAFLIFAGLGASIGYGPLHFLRSALTSTAKGNSKQFGFDKIERLDGNPLEGKNICVLGSSVVFGHASQEESVAEYFGRRFGCAYTKEAVSGTTLVDSGSLSYVSRLRKLDRSVHYDLFICQLSTNDATKEKPLGEISAGPDYDTSTVTGAMEFIINYARDTWNCPVVFFTGSRYESENYAAMVRRLLELREKYGIGVLDLWSDDDFNNIPDDLREIYMSDPIHPTKAGYRDWWCPEMEKQLLGYLNNQPTNK